jgi:hypothetical protein
VAEKFDPCYLRWGFAIYDRIPLYCLRFSILRGLQSMVEVASLWGFCLVEGWYEGQIDERQSTEEYRPIHWIGRIDYELDFEED